MARGQVSCGSNLLSRPVLTCVAQRGSPARPPGLLLDCADVWEAEACPSGTFSEVTAWVPGWGSAVGAGGRAVPVLSPAEVRPSVRLSVLSSGWPAAPQGRAVLFPTPQAPRLGPPTKKVPARSPGARGGQAEGEPAGNGQGSRLAPGSERPERNVTHTST